MLYSQALRAAQKTVEPTILDYLGPGGAQGWYTVTEAVDYLAQCGSLTGLRGYGMLLRRDQQAIVRSVLDRLVKRGWADRCCGQRNGRDVKEYLILKQGE